MIALILCCVAISFMCAVWVGKLKLHIARLERQTQTDGQILSAFQRKIQDLEKWRGIFAGQLHRHEQAAGGFWTTGNGTVLRIRDMSDVHVEQAIEWSKANGRDTTFLRAERSRQRRNRRLTSAYWNER
jgi:hypothetical protein